MDCKMESADGWYDSMYTLMESAAESAQNALCAEEAAAALNGHHGLNGYAKRHRHRNGSIQNGDHHQNGVLHDDDDDEKKEEEDRHEVDRVALSNALYLNYEMMDRKRRKKKLWPMAKNKKSASKRGRGGLLLFVF